MKWATINPLTGGMPLGAERALGTKPVCLVDLPGVEALSEHYRANYVVPYYPVDVCGEAKALSALRKADLVVAVPPCNGLSTYTVPNGVNKALETSNSFIRSILQMAFDAGVKCVIGENAPRLFTPGGRDVADMINGLCSENGYGLSLVRIDPTVCGLPQRRPRTFFIATKGGARTGLRIEHVSHSTAAQLLRKIPRTASLQKGVRQYRGDMDADVRDNAMFKWANLTFEGGLRQRAAKYGGTRSTILKLADLDNLFYSALKYVKREGDDFWIRKLQHIIGKKKRGLGFWDESPCVIKEIAPSVIQKTVQFCVHPVKDRWITVREAMTLMGLPHDFELAVGTNSLDGGSITTKYNHICQNVPVNTAAAVIDAVVKTLTSTGNWSLDRRRVQAVGDVVRYDAVKQNETVEIS